MPPTEVDDILCILCYFVIINNSNFRKSALMIAASSKEQLLNFEATDFALWINVPQYAWHDCTNLFPNRENSKKEFSFYL